MLQDVCNATAVEVQLAVDLLENAIHNIQSIPSFAGKASPATPKSNARPPTAYLTPDFRDSRKLDESPRHGKSTLPASFDPNRMVQHRPKTRSPLPQLAKEVQVDGTDSILFWRISASLQSEDSEAQAGPGRQKDSEEVRATKPLPEQPQPGGTKCEQKTKQQANAPAAQGQSEHTPSQSPQANALPRQEPNPKQQQRPDTTRTLPPAPVAPVWPIRPLSDLNSFRNSTTTAKCAAWLDDAHQLSQSPEPIPVSITGHPKRWHIINDIRHSLKQCLMDSNKALQYFKDAKEVVADSEEQSETLRKAEVYVEHLIEIFKRIFVTLRAQHDCIGLCADWHKKHDRRFFLFHEHLQVYLATLQAGPNQAILKLANFSIQFNRWLSKITKYYKKYDVFLVQEEIQQIHLERTELDREFAEMDLRGYTNRPYLERYMRKEKEYEDRIEEESERLKRLMRRLMEGTGSNVYPAYPNV